MVAKYRRKESSDRMEGNMKRTEIKSANIKKRKKEIRYWKKRKNEDKENEKDAKVKDTNSKFGIG